MQRRSHMPRSRPLLSQGPKIKISFKDLPAEIRNAIYSYAIPTSQTIKPKVQCHFDRLRAIERGSCQTFALGPERILALARTCKQIHDEVLPVYFGRNTFDFESAYELYMFLYMIGYARRSLVRDVRVFLVQPGFQNVWGDSRTKRKGDMPMRELLKMTFDMLADCTSLQKLHLGIQNETRQVIDPDGRKLRCRLATLRKSGVFENMRGLETLDLRVREVLYWTVNWATVHSHQQDSFGNWKLVPCFHQFEEPLEDQTREQNNIRYSSMLGVEELRDFEKGLKEDFARAKVDDDVKVIDVVARRNRNPLKRAEEFVRRENLVLLREAEKSFPKESTRKGTGWKLAWRT